MEELRQRRDRALFVEKDELKLSFAMPLNWARVSRLFAFLVS